MPSQPPPPGERANEATRHLPIQEPERHNELAAATVLVSGGRPAHHPGAELTQPLSLNATYIAGGAVDYARSGNPTWDAFEDTLGRLEGGSALVFASGTAAIHAVLDLVPSGGRIGAPRTVYSGTAVALDDLATSGDAEVTRVDIADTPAVLAAIAAGPAPELVWIESPVNPTLEVADVETIAAAAHARGALVAADNTFATPLLARPLTQGADIVAHSVTKYLAGHSDVILGALVTAQNSVHREAGVYESLRAKRSRRGAIAGPAEVWLALRGMRTLHVRLERACANAATLVARLREHPGVMRVRYPGFGAIISIEVGDASRADAVADAVTLWTNATSLGGVESLLERRRRHAAEPVSVPTDLLRLSVGIEDVEDLWADLDRALRPT
ncbi:MAG: PLP-dependent transferase [Micrococcales bacterium]|nr:PLP-dependent transferase [Micrococcales bacterium]